MTGEPETPRRARLFRSALLPLLRMARLAEQPAEASPVEEVPAREDCACGDDDEFEYREPVLDGGEWVLRCPECGLLDRLRWLSDDARAVVLGLARRRWRLRMRKAVKP